METFLVNEIEINMPGSCGNLRTGLSTLMGANTAKKYVAMRNR